ncbi:protein serine threonine kinase [Nesidiocoris tenuis]|uniref:Protein serine threonine kinase n=1 Tax=Nesidiocoris tenuis TaxID=355587 RepID=A0ABN7B921_9HEMI|nr:protein serine threonine kinase [Nesidiocoris tenuis]
MIFLLVLALCAFGSHCQDEDQSIYYKVFEDIDPDTILDNERILQSYLKCFYGEGHCNTHAQLAKGKNIRNFLSKNCAFHSLVLDFCKNLVRLFRVYAALRLSGTASTRRCV